MAKSKVQQIEVTSMIEHLTDSNTGIKLEKLDTGYTALVSEVTVHGEVEGTILYIPGVSYKILQGK